MRHNQSTEGSKRAEFWTGCVLFLCTTEEKHVCSKLWLRSTVFKWDNKEKTMLSAKEHPSLSWRTIEFDTAYIAFSLEIRGPQNKLEPYLSSQEMDIRQQRKYKNMQQSTLSSIQVLLAFRHQRRGHKQCACLVLAQTSNYRTNRINMQTMCRQRQIHTDTEEEVWQTEEVCHFHKKYSRPEEGKWYKKKS